MGGPVFIDDICAVYSLQLRPIVEIGYDKFQQYLSILTATKPVDVKDDKELAELLSTISDYQYLLLMVTMDAQVNSLVKAAFRFFTHSEATFSLDPPAIFLGPIEEKHILDEKHFYDLQQLLRRM